MSLPIACMDDMSFDIGSRAKSTADTNAIHTNLAIEILITIVRFIIIRMVIFQTFPIML